MTEERARPAYEPSGPVPHVVTEGERPLREDDASGTPPPADPPDPADPADPVSEISEISEADAADGEETGGPPSPDRSARPRRRGPLRRFLLVLTSLLSLTIVVATVTGWVVVTRYDSQIDRETIAPPADITVTRPPPAPVGSETWLLVGSDVRTGSDAAKVSGARSDTMMIAHLSSDGTTQVVSIPRDLRVPIPAWTDEDGQRHRARADKVNAAFSAGGPALLVATLEQVAGLRIDHYAELDFTGFQQMTSAIGGIDVCLRSSPYVEVHELDNHRRVRSTNLNDPSSGFVGQVGTNHLIGENALAFVRQRHGFADGDLSRIRRQQAFLAAMFRKVASEQVLLSPTRLASFLNAVTHSVVLDEETGLSELRALASRMHGMTTGAVSFATVPITGQVTAPAFYFLYDPDEMRQFFRDITGDTTPFEPADTFMDPLELSGSLTPTGPAGGESRRSDGMRTPPPSTAAAPSPRPSSTPAATGSPAGAGAPDGSTEPEQGTGTGTGTGAGTEATPRPGATVAPEAPPSAAPTSPGTWSWPWPTAPASTALGVRRASWTNVVATGRTVATAPTSPSAAVSAAAGTGGAADTAADTAAADTGEAGEAPVTAAAACIY